MNVIVLLGLPLAAAALSCLPWRRFAPAVTIASCLAVLADSVDIARRVVGSGPAVVAPNWIVVDGLSALVLLLIAFVGVTAAFFSWGYMSAEAHAPKRLASTTSITTSLSFRCWPSRSWWSRRWSGSSSS